jgi:hypothetical protein
MIDEDRVERILQRIIDAVRPDQEADGFHHIFTALEAAISFQMALLCSDCRRRLARQLRSDIPAMITRASQLQREVQEEYGEHHLH